ncbi:MAG: sigma-54-dependent Fis family transcriptional regulator [Deltaproteobacteria bacterium]|nr:sigma-54-dependent Fis family transcriptional regulator [Deltaproteobacteria bacterium]
MISPLERSKAKTLKSEDCFQIFELNGRGKLKRPINWDLKRFRRPPIRERETAIFRSSTGRSGPPCDLVKEVESGNFREDLYYRLNVVPLIVPPLRERGNDSILLAQHLLARYAHRYKKPVPELTGEGKTSLKAYPWPGNIRELKNVIERSMIMFDGERLDLTIPMAPRKSKDPLSAPTASFSDKPAMDELQRRYINYILQETRGKISGPQGAAKILGMKRSTLYTRMKKLGLLA